MFQSSTNGAGPAGEAAAGREDQRDVGELGFGAGGRAASAGAPDPELVEQARRRTFTAEYKARILADADACAKPGEVGAARKTWNTLWPGLATTATCFPSGENAPAITPCFGVLVSVPTIPWPQSDAWVENGTLLTNSISPKTSGGPAWDPKTRILLPSGDHEIWRPRFQSP